MPFPVLCLASPFLALPCREALTACLRAAACAGAACCEVLGGLPPLGAKGRERVVELMGGDEAVADVLPTAR